MDYDAQWRAILQEGSFSGEAGLILPDGEVVTLRGMESAGDNGKRDSETGRWSNEKSDSYHSFTVPAADFYGAIGDDIQVDECLLELGGKRYGIIGVTGTEMMGQALRLWLRMEAEGVETETGTEEEEA